MSPAPSHTRPALSATRDAWASGHQTSAWSAAARLQASFPAMLRALSLALVLAAAGCEAPPKAATGQPAPPPGPMATVQTATIRAGTVDEVLEVYGEVVPPGV